MSDGGVFPQVRPVADHAVLVEFGETIRYDIHARVLALDAAIVDLYINAPDVTGASPVQRYTLSVGEMTLQAELRDSPTGEVLARVLDRREGRDRGVFELTTSVDNAAAAREAARAWAAILRRQLDAAKDIGRRP